MKAAVRGTSACLILTAVLVAVAAGPVSAVPTITPSGNTASFSASDFTVEYATTTMPPLTVTVTCGGSTFSADIVGTTSANMGFSLVRTFCTNSLGCATTVTTKVPQSLTAIANLGSGTYSFGMTIGELGFILHCSGTSCAVTITGQTFADATTWTNTAKELSISDDTLTWTGTGAGCFLFKSGTAKLTVTYVQTNSPAMVVTGS